MTQEQITTLAQVYNALYCVETKGDSTRTMAKCLETLEGLILQLQNEQMKGVETNR